MAIVLGYVAGNQLLGVSRDYQDYLQFFDWSARVPLEHALSHRFENGFTLLVAMLNEARLDSVSVYAVIAGVAIFVKYFALQSRNHFWLIFTAFTFYYLLRYYTLFEMTVLRATVALALAFYVFYTRDRYEVRIKHIALLALASTMHVSSVIFLPIYLIKPAGRVVVIGVGLICFVSVVLAQYAVFEVLATYIPLLNSYRGYGQASLLPVPFAFDIAFLVFVLANWARNDCLMKTSAMGMVIGVAMHYSLLEHAILAGRFRELLSVFYLLYVVRAVTYPRTFVKYGSIAFMLVTALLYAYATYIHDPLLT
jgi:hypothetical protein